MTLNEEQIEEAAKFSHEVFNKINSKHMEHYGVYPWRISWLELSDAGRDAWRKTVVSVAPYLQMPWHGPATDEADACLSKAKMNGFYLPEIHTAIAEFVKIRNAALSPKPSEPRLEVVNRSLRANLYGDVEKLAQAIIQALDSKEKGCD